MLALAVFLVAHLQAPGTGCSGSSRTIVTDSTVGPIRLGDTIRGVRGRCRIVRDTVQPNSDFVEPERVLSISVGGDTVQAVVDTAGVVTRIYVDAPRFRTADGLGVGTKLRTLAARGASGGQAESTFGVSLPRHCGLRFVIAGMQGVQQGDELDATHLRQQPTTASVKRIEIVGCRS